MGLISTMFESTATLKRPTPGQDSAKGTTQKYNVVSGISWPLPCSLQENSVTALDLNNQRVTVTRTSLFFAQDPTCQINDQFVVTEIRTGIVKLCNVIGQAQPVARGRFFTVDVEIIPMPSS